MGISDRSYYSDTGFSKRIASVVSRLILCNICVFFLVFLFRPLSLGSYLVLTPKNVFFHLMFWQPISYMFVHYGFFHILMNMLMLWFFGKDLENIWGGEKFLQFYLFCGIGAALCSLSIPVYWNAHVAGASGAVFGVLVAYAFLFPEREILLFFIVPMKMKYAVLLFVGINLYNAIASSFDGTAYFTHLGGGLFGYLYLKNSKIQRLLAFFSWSEFKENRYNARIIKENRQKEAVRRKVDLLLDKIAVSGINSLTRQEKSFLKHQSRQRQT
ncbi:MAG: rhomboid family intramembrane serine protease [Candidatus Omnitrophica bacterium]|nr:rhomboid family intramembrane serine protease [Candidatus Omnitrophota bacterium]